MLYLSGLHFRGVNIKIKWTGFFYGTGFPVPLLLWMFWCQLFLEWCMRSKVLTYSMISMMPPLAGNVIGSVESMILLPWIPSIYGAVTVLSFSASP